MKINIWWAKRWLAFILVGVVPLTMFILLVFSGFDLLLSTVVALLFIPAMGFIVRRTLLKHPFMDYLEGKGIIVKTIDSTGLIKTFLVDLQPPFLRGKLDNVEVEDVFDRHAMMYETPPTKTTGRIEDGKMIIEIPLDEAHTYQFREHVYPVFIWNENLKTFLTKDSIAKLETDTLLDHALLYLVRKIEDLDRHLRDFARHVVDLSKPPAFSIFEAIRRHPLAFLILIILIAVIGAMFLFPNIFGNMVNIGAGAVNPTPAPTPSTAGAVVPK